MTRDELVERDRADRLRVLDAALADARRGLAVRAAQRGRTDAIERNIARLERELCAFLETAAR